MRCFVAVDLSPAVRAGIAAAQRALRAAAPHADVRWTDPAGWHLTLQFLGEVPEARVPDVDAALAGVAAATAPVELAACGLGGFPSARRARVLWAGVPGGEAGLARLAAAVGAALAPLGYPPEAHPFRAHVTVGRVRSPRGAGALAPALAAAHDTAFGTWTAADVVLYRSQLRRTGAVYSPVARHPLRAGRT